MAKIVTRDQLLKRYEENHKIIITDPMERLLRYFEENKLNFDKAKKKAEEKLIKICNEREYHKINMTLYEYPMKTDRPRTFGGHTFSPNAKKNKEYLLKAIKKIKKTIRLINTPAKIKIDAYLETPKNVPPDEIILFECKVLDIVDTPDYDNISKCYTDMLTDVLTTDDDIFYKAIITKFYSLLPRVEISIEFQTKHESNYIYKKLKSRKSIKEAIAQGLLQLESMVV